VTCIVQLHLDLVGAAFSVMLYGQTASNFFVFVSVTSVFYILLILAPSFTFDTITTVKYV
jgi:hypothetical protein